MSKRLVVSGWSALRRCWHVKTLLPRFSTNMRKGYGELPSEAEHSRWVKQREQLSEDRLDIEGHPVMQRWETPYMGKLAEVATRNGGRVVEVGFGMAISATAVQSYPIEEHIILEANSDVFKRLEEFAKAATSKVTPLGPDLWQNSIKHIADRSVDGILYDTYPLNKEEQHTHQFDFLREARRILKPGGIMTYCNLTSLGVLRHEYNSWEELFEATQKPHLLAAGYHEDELLVEAFPVEPTADCEYYSHNTAMVPIIRKRSSSPSGACGAIGGHGGHRAFSSSAGLRGLSWQGRRSFGSEAREVHVAQHKVGPQGHGRKLNAWTQWGELKECVVGVADNACFPPVQPAMIPEINDPVLRNVLGEWPRGRKSQRCIDAANQELDNLVNVLEGEGVKTLRPEVMDWSQPLRTPLFAVENQYVACCVRDTVITVGKTAIEAAMSRRDRYFEILAVRQILRDLWREDPEMLWKAAPKPSMADDMYDLSWWDWTDEERYEHMHKYRYCINNEEPIFDAADITRCGKDIFVQPSMTCNYAGIEWLRRELAPQGIRVHSAHFPYDLAPSHIDCTFVILGPHLVLTNPERPIADRDAEFWKENGWQFVDCGQPDNPERPAFSQSSKWLSMNIFVIGPGKVIVEEQEKGLQNLLKHQCGFTTVIPIPFRNVFEYGGSLHCSTWDTRREDDMVDLFPKQRNDDPALFKQHA
ncbi:GATM [Symbiodinium natans]|uniref:Glycine amidinotransferase, mitochondrial n=1 Tax=Symbiodinium natans TaxID=878477 RepID=A0A812I1P4_9DINO|nr:GATM [Symbiodinium natans]